MKNSIVVIDIDNTLANYTEALREYCQSKTSLEYPCPEPNLYDFGVQRGWPWKDKSEYRRIHLAAVKAGLYLTERPYFGALWALHRLQQNGCLIIIATSRKDDERCDTYRWLTNGQIPFDGLYFGDKLSINADLWIEDDPQTLHRLGERRLPALHPSHEYCREFYGETYSEWKDVPPLALKMLNKKNSKPKASNHNNERKRNDYY